MAFEVEDKNLKAIKDELSKMGEISISLLKYRQKRTLDANSYLWVLIDRLAEEIGIEKTRIYKNAVKEIGGASEVVQVSDDGVARLRECWARNGIGWQSDILGYNGQYTSVCLYYGSSVYDSKQMSALIDVIVQECKAVGIETLPPEELNRIKAMWNGGEK